MCSPWPLYRWRLDPVAQLDYEKVRYWTWLLPRGRIQKKHALARGKNWPLINHQQLQSNCRVHPLSSSAQPSKTESTKAPSLASLYPKGNSGTRPICHGSTEKKFIADPPLDGRLFEHSNWLSLNSAARYPRERAG